MEIGQIKRYRKGEAIIREEAPAFNVYIINKGHAQVLKRYGEREVAIGSLGEGDVFGEMAFIGETERTATVVASSDMEVQRITQKDFTESLKALPVDGIVFYVRVGIGLLCPFALSIAALFLVRQEAVTRSEAVLTAAAICIIIGEVCSRILFFVTTAPLSVG